MGREQIVGLIIDECRMRYGQGQVFYRTDGLAFEERREAGLDPSTATLEQRARAALSIAGELRPAGETSPPPPTAL